MLNADEASQMRSLDELVMDVVGVDDFDSSELGTKAKKPRRPRKKATPRKSASKRSPAAGAGPDAGPPS